MKISHLTKIIAAAVGYLVVNVLISVAVVAFYAYFVNPGHPNHLYEEFARQSAPYSSIFAGMPLMFALCRWLGKKWDFRSIVGIWIVYMIIDLTVLFLSGMTVRLAIFAAISLATKLAAAVLGARASKWRSE